MRDEWRTGGLDVAGYLRRIGYDGEWDTSLGTLVKLHRAHVGTIPFENIDVLMGLGIDLDLDTLQDKLVTRRRGGYCFEHNLLFAAALERAGFPVTRLCARAWPDRPEILPRTHMVLAVECAGRTWLCDVGFGGLGLLGPVALTDGADVRHDDWRYGIVRQHGEWVLRAHTADGWLSLYTFTEEPQHLVDYIVANHFIATHPDSPFVHRLVVQRVTAPRRLELLDRTLTETTPTGTTQRQTTDLGRLLATDFGLSLDEATLTLLNART